MKLRSENFAFILIKVATATRVNNFLNLFFFQSPSAPIHSL